jgi:hypothetical protein
MINFTTKGVSMDKRKILFSIIYKPSRLWIVLWLLAAILIGFETMAYADDGKTDEGTQGKSLIVKNWKGEYIGTSRHVILDPSTGNIIFIIVSLNQKENKEIAVPAGLFSVDNEHGHLVLNVSKEKLNSSPAYHSSDLQDPEFIDKVYRFFAIAPPWAEDTPKGENDHFLRF